MSFQFIVVAVSVLSTRIAARDKLFEEAHGAVTTGAERRIDAALDGLSEPAPEADMQVELKFSGDIYAGGTSPVVTTDFCTAEIVAVPAAAPAEAETDAPPDVASTEASAVDTGGVDANGSPVDPVDPVAPATDPVPETDLPASPPVDPAS